MADKIKKLRDHGQAKILAYTSKSFGKQIKPAEISLASAEQSARDERLVRIREKGGAIWGRSFEQNTDNVAIRQQ